jgi:hypothetical protein
LAANSQGCSAVSTGVRQPDKIQNRLRELKIKNFFIMNSLDINDACAFIVLKMNFVEKASS